MPTAQDILDHKGSKVVTVSPGDSVTVAVHRMNAERVGAAVVCGEDPDVLGIFTERDILQRIVGQDRSPAGTKVGDVMTSPVACCKPTTTVRECQGVMTSKRIRHLPVVDEGALVGIISIGDLMAREVEDQQSTIEYLHAYLHGRM